MSADEKIKELKSVVSDSDAYAAMIFGSYVKDESFNDIDVAVFTDTNIDSLVAEAPGIFDIARFQDLPMYIRHRVLKEGELIFCRDEDRYYEDAIDFVKAYEDFKPIYREYLEGVRSRG